MANTLSHMLGNNTNDPNIIPVTNEKEVTIHPNMIEIKNSNKTVLLNTAHYKRALIVNRAQDQSALHLTPQSIEIVSVFFSDNYEHRFSGSKEFIDRLLSTFRNAEKFNPTAEHKRFKFKIGEEIKSPEPLGYYCEFAIREIVRIELENVSIGSAPRVMMHIKQTVEGANKHVAFVAQKFITPNLIFHWTRSW